MHPENFAVTGGQEFDSFASLMRGDLDGANANLMMATESLAEATLAYQQAATDQAAEAASYNLQLACSTWQTANHAVAYAKENLALITTLQQTTAARFGAYVAACQDAGLIP